MLKGKVFKENNTWYYEVVAFTGIVIIGKKCVGNHCSWHRILSSCLADIAAIERIVNAGYHLTDPQDWATLLRNQENRDIYAARVRRNDLPESRQPATNWSF